MSFYNRYPASYQYLQHQPYYQTNQSVPYTQSVYAAAAPYPIQVTGVRGRTPVQQPPPYIQQSQQSIYPPLPVSNMNQSHNVNSNNVNIGQQNTAAVDLVTDLMRFYQRNRQYIHSKIGNQIQTASEALT